MMGRSTVEEAEAGGDMPLRGPVRGPVLGPVRGAFRERAGDAHIALRDKILAPSALPLLPVRPVPAPEDVGFALRQELAARGVALLRLDAPLTDEAFIALGSSLGTLLPEGDPDLAAYVRLNVILNVVDDHAETAPTAMQPFSSRYLTLHSEGSGRPLREQPRFVVLHCDEAPEGDGAGLTVLSPMRAVHGRLSDAARAALRTMRYDRPGVPPILREDRLGEPVFSFRDFERDRLHWVSDRGTGDAGNEALRALLVSLYTEEFAMGIAWRRGMLAVIDNHRYFHGRTAADRPSAGTRRLRRLRVLSKDEGGHE